MSPLIEIAVIGCIALLLGAGFAALRQAPLLGYVLAGVILGPSVLGLVGDHEEIHILADIGVLLLLFLIGIDLKLECFLKVWKVALGFTVLQLGGLCLVALIVWQVTTIPLGIALFCSFALSLSSTAVAIKMLDQSGAENKKVGSLVIGILIAQDLSVIPMLVILPALASAGGGVEIIKALTVAGIGFLLLGGIIYAMSRKKKILPSLLAFTVNSEITAISAVVFCLGSAVVCGFLGLSEEYGAFLAGLLLGNTQENKKIRNATHPLQALLMMVFFVLVGLLVDIKFIVENLTIISLLLLVVTVGKTLMNAFWLKILSTPNQQAFFTATILGQIGEFSFILLTLAKKILLVDSYMYELSVSLITLSLVISPIWLLSSRFLQQWGLGRAERFPPIR